MTPVSQAFPSRRLPRVFLKVGAGVALLVLALWLLASPLRGVVETALTPSEPFAAQTPPPAPDYARTESWAALPDRADGADALPMPGSEDRQPVADADVFFLHAGANITSRWNQAVDYWLVQNLVDGGMMPLLASVFNGCCRVYAPRFRQEAILRNPALEGERQQAIALAYEDVRRAFRHYLEHDNHGRPLILAGANSGGRHALRLLIEEVAGTPLQSRLVAAYLVATPVDAAARAKLGSIAICDGPEQTGCVNVFSAIGRQHHAAHPPSPERKSDACVNPLSWRADDRHVPRTLNRAGSIVGGSRSALWGDVAKPKAVPAMADAQCQDGRLLVTPTELLANSYQPGGPGDYHSLNIQLFYGSIRDNARARVEAFQRRGGERADCPPDAVRAPQAALPPSSAGDGCAAAAPSPMPGSLGTHWPGALPALLR